LDNPQSLNLYGYVSNNPLSKTDSDGHLSSPWHFAITFVAALNTDHSISDSAKMAAQNTAVDFRKGSQGTDAASTNMHAMRGTTKDGSIQTTAEGHAGTAKVVTDAMKKGDTALAGHDAIDAAVPLHDGHVWEGLGLNVDTAKHELEDSFPSALTIVIAYGNEKSVLQGTNPLTSVTPAPTSMPPPQP
jgi:hypothetical protein